MLRNLLFASGKPPTSPTTGLATARGAARGARCTKLATRVPPPERTLVTALLATTLLATTLGVPVRVVTLRVVVTRLETSRGAEIGERFAAAAVGCNAARVAVLRATRCGVRTGAAARWAVRTTRLPSACAVSVVDEPPSTKAARAAARIRQFLFMKSSDQPMLLIFDGR